MAVEILRWKSFKNTLRGFFNIHMTNIGLEIRDCTLHEKNGEKWVHLPSRPFKKEDGTMGNAYIVKFTENDRREEFQKATLEALDRRIGQNPY